MRTWVPALQLALELLHPRAAGGQAGAVGQYSLGLAGRQPLHPRRRHLVVPPVTRAGPHPSQRCTGCMMIAR